MERNKDQEQELLNTLRVVLDHFNDNLVPLQGIVNQLDKLINDSKDRITQLENKERTDDAEINKPTT